MAALAHTVATPRQRPAAPPRHLDTMTDTETLQRPRIDELLLYVDITPNPDLEYYAHADHLGSVLALVDDTGAIAESYRYTEWGVPTILDDSFARQSAGSTSPVGNPVMYTGQKYAPVASGSGEIWYDYRARHYRADAGRFVQRIDPSGQATHYVEGSVGGRLSRSHTTNSGNTSFLCDWAKCGKAFCETALGIADSLDDYHSVAPCVMITCDCNLPESPCGGKQMCGQTFNPGGSVQPPDGTTQVPGCSTICIQYNPDVTSGFDACGSFSGSGGSCNSPLSNVIQHELGHTDVSTAACWTQAYDEAFQNSIDSQTNSIQPTQSAVDAAWATMMGGPYGPTGPSPTLPAPTKLAMACAAQKAATAAAEACVHNWQDLNGGGPCDN